ncbi:hypothetical protein GBA52_015987 [Prunus armeniaca]|nr:hypothetical protein GBA52_015987 [Prunus armeniaca]
MARIRFRRVEYIIVGLGTCGCCHVASQVAIYGNVGRIILLRLRSESTETATVVGQLINVKADGALRSPRRMCPSFVSNLRDN